MRYYLKQNSVRALGVLDEKPILAKLIAHGEFMPVKAKIKPHLKHSVGHKFGYLGSLKFFGDLIKIIKKDGFGKTGKMPRTVVHFDFQQVID
jgi:hypothetical protein